MDPSLSLRRLRRKHFLVVCNRTRLSFLPNKGSIRCSPKPSSPKSFLFHPASQSLSPRSIINVSVDFLPLSSPVLPLDAARNTVHAYFSPSASLSAEKRAERRKQRGENHQGDSSFEGTLVGAVHTAVFGTSGAWAGWLAITIRLTSCLTHGGL